MLRRGGTLAATAHDLVDDTAGDGHDDHRERQRIDRGRHAELELRRDVDRQGLVVADREQRRIEVVERLHERERRGRHDRRFEIGQRDRREDLERRRAQIERRLLLGRVEALQPRDEDQHAVGADEARLAEHGQHPGPLDLGDAVPEDRCRQADDDARQQDRRDEHRVERVARRRAVAGEQERPAQPQQRRHTEHADTDQHAAPQRVP
ncbi:MAG: hypothetical protein U1F51_05365 [Burkholderiales bacterium]